MSRTVLRPLGGVCVIVCVACVAACGGRVQGARPQIPPRQYDVWALDVVTGNVHALTRSRAAELSPEFSPDGRSIAFERDGANAGLYVMTAAGRNVRRVARVDGINGPQDGSWRGPQWSPDGSEIAWPTAAACDDLGCDIWRVRIAAADGSGSTFFAADAGAPTWSPDGNAIAYEGGLDHEGTGKTIYVRARAGGAPRAIAVGRLPLWSATNWIAYHRGTSLRVVRPEGSGDHALVDDHEIGSGAGDFGWSSDGSRLWFTHETATSGDDELYTVTLAGGVTRVTRSPGDDGLATWMPGRDQIAWLRTDLLMTPFDASTLMTADNQGVRRLAAAPVIAVREAPSSSRDGSTLVFAAWSPNSRAERGPNALWKLDLASGDAEPLPDAKGDGEAPSLSRTGKLAFYEDDAGGTFLWTSRADGGDRRRIGPAGAEDFLSWWPAQWSARGDLAYVRDDGCETALCDSAEIWVLRAGADRPRRVTTGSHPTWSPDGASLAFADGDSVGVVGANGRGRRMLARGSLPAWAPRGDLIAYDAYDNKAVVDRLVVAAADGSRRRALATSVGEPFDFAWSADGQSIVFASTSLWKVDVAGGKPRLLRGVPGAPEHLSPSVSPDGRRLAWISLPSLDGEQLNDINVGDADGTNARRVSQRRQLVASPLTWSPDGNTLFYAAWPHRID